MTTENIEIINGCTDVKDFEYADAHDLTTVIICDGVQTIGNQSFANCENLKFVFLPDSIRKIECNSFENSGVIFRKNDKEKKQTIMVYCKKNSYADIWANTFDKYIVVNN